MELVNHVIRKNTLNIKAVTRDAFALQSRIARLLNDAVLPRLSDVFDAISNENEYLLIERLDIHLEDISEDAIEQDFVEQLIQCIRKAIEEKKKIAQHTFIKQEEHEVVAKFSRQERALQAFNYFLEKGMLPWWYDSAAQGFAHASFEEEILLAFLHYQSSSRTVLEHYISRLRELLTSRAVAIRLTEQFSQSVLNAVLEAVLYEHDVTDTMAIQTARKALTSVIQKHLRPEIARRFLKEMDSYLLQKAIMPSTIQKRVREWLLEILRQQDQLTQLDFSAIMASIQEHDYLKQFLPQEWPTLQRSQEAKHDALIKEINRPAKSERQQDLKKEIAEAEGVMIKNAGLVIIAPFLPQLFNDCKLRSENEITDPYKAIALMHYLVFGNLEYREYDTVLNKIICGLDTETSMNIQLVEELSATELSHANEVLTSVIEHWGVLKNTSPDGLREGFLQRPGKLSLTHDNWLLKVEQHAIDILLQSLPWTIGMIKLPWMKTMLKTDWN